MKYHQISSEATCLFNPPTIIHLRNVIVDFMIRVFPPLCRVLRQTLRRRTIHDDVFIGSQLCIWRGDRDGWVRDPGELDFA